MIIILQNTDKCKEKKTAQQHKGQILEPMDSITIHL